MMSVLQVITPCAEITGLVMALKPERWRDIIKLNVRYFGGANEKNRLKPARTAAEIAHG